MGLKCTGKFKQISINGKIYVFGYMYRASCTVYFPDHLTQKVFVYIYIY